MHLYFRPCVALLTPLPGVARVVLLPSTQLLATALLPQPPRPQRHQRHLSMIISNYTPSRPHMLKRLGPWGVCDV